MKLYLDYKYLDENKKSTLVFLHGWGLSKNAFLSVVNNLKNNPNILCLDFFGFGNSSEPEKYFDTYEYAYYIFRLINKLNLKSVIFVGHSFGGRVALILSSVFKVKVKKLILTSSAGVNNFDLIKKFKILKYKIIKKLVKLKLVNKNNLNKYGSCDYKNCSENLKEVFVKVVNQDLKKHLNKISALTLLVWDKKDNETKYSICKALNRGIKNSKIILFKTGKHFAYVYNVRKFSNLIDDLCE